MVLTTRALNSYYQGGRERSETESSELLFNYKAAVISNNTEDEQRQGSDDVNEP